MLSNLTAVKTSQPHKTSLVRTLIKLLYVLRSGAGENRTPVQTVFQKHVNELNFVEKIGFEPITRDINLVFCQLNYFPDFKTYPRKIGFV